MISPSFNKKIYLFSSLARSYDFVCIGSTALKVASLTQQQNNKIKFTKLYVQQSDTHFEASLAILGQEEIKLSNKTEKNTDIRLFNQIQKIDPNKNSLILKNGEQIKYRHLIYSGEDQDWKDRNCIKGLETALRSRHTATFADVIDSKVSDLYSKINQDIYFNIGSKRHFGMDNYFMLHLAFNLKKVSKQLGISEDCRIKLLNVGTQLIPSNSEVDATIKRLLQQNGVEIVSGVVVEEVCHRTRSLVVKKNNETQKLKYGAFYQYLPFKVPDLLVRSQINPLEVDHRTLVNKKFPNVHVVGNILPTPFSFYGLNYMCHVISQNIINSQLKSNKFAVYEGDTILPFWTGLSSLRYFHMDYEKTKIFNNWGEHRLQGWIQGLDRQKMGRSEVQKYYNSKSYGIPYYIIPPKIKEVRKEIESKEGKILSAS